MCLRGVLTLVLLFRYGEALAMADEGADQDGVAKGFKATLYSNRATAKSKVRARVLATFLLLSVDIAHPEDLCPLCAFCS